MPTTLLPPLRPHVLDSCNLLLQDQGESKCKEGPLRFHVCYCTENQWKAGKTEGRGPQFQDDGNLNLKSGNRMDLRNTRKGVSGTRWFIGKGYEEKLRKSETRDDTQVSVSGDCGRC